MAIKTGVCRSYKAEILQGVHAVEDEYRMALYGADASLDDSTPEYTPDGEVEGRGYEAGGAILSGVRVAGTGLAFDEPVWNASTIAAHGGMIYNASKGNRAVAVFSFGGEVASRNGRFFVKVPSGDNGAVRI